MKSFLYKHRQLIYPYIDEFNKVNKSKGVKIYKRSFYAISALPPIDFFEKLKEFHSIKSGILYINSSEKTKSVDVVDVLEEELIDNNISEFDLEIKIKNKSPLGMMKAFKAYFEKINELQKYDSYAIEGVTKSGTVKKITPDSITREFEAEIEVNNQGLYNIVQIFNEMEEVITSNNPLESSGNRRLNNSLLLKDVKNVEKAIKQIAEAINKPQEDKEETIKRKAE